MKAHTHFSLVLFALLLFLCTPDINAQSCKQAFYSAKEQYNGGQFESAQNLLNTCFQSFAANKDHYHSNPDEVYKVYKLYIASCTKNGNTALADNKRNELISFFSGTFSSDQVINTLNNTSL